MPIPYGTRIVDYYVLCMYQYIVVHYTTPENISLSVVSLTVVVIAPAGCGARRFSKIDTNLRFAHTQVVVLADYQNLIVSKATQAAREGACNLLLPSLHDFQAPRCRGRHCGSGGMGEIGTLLDLNNSSRRVE